MAVFAGLTAQRQKGKVITVTVLTNRALNDLGTLLGKGIVVYWEMGELTELYYRIKLHVLAYQLFIGRTFQRMGKFNVIRTDAKTLL